jgi:AcrR family transcriptional regulator
MAAEGAAVAYHHGDLRAALVRGGRDQLAEAGLAGFSVARVARRVGVSSAAPYRHFPDREALLAAVVGEVAADLTDAIRVAADAAGEDPADRLVAAAGAYTRHVLTQGVGFDLLYLRELRASRFGELHEQTRALLDLLTQLGDGAAPSPTPTGVPLLVSQAMSTAHGFATLTAGGLTPADAPLTVDETAARTRDAVRALIAGNRVLGP